MLHDKELRAWLSLAIPSGLRSLLELLPWLCSLSMLGRVGTRELSALSLTETWIYGWMTISWTGMSITQSTLISQAHGARRIGSMRAWAILSFTSSLLLAFIVGGAWFAAPYALDSFGFDPVLVELATSYTYAAMPILFLETFNICVSIYLMAMQVALLPLAVGAFTALVDVVASYLLIFGADPEIPRLSNSLRGAGLGWTIGATATVIANLFVLRWAFGRELDYGTSDIEEEEDERARNCEEDLIHERVDNVEEVIDESIQSSRGENLTSDDSMAAPLLVLHSPKSIHTGYSIHSTLSSPRPITGGVDSPFLSSPWLALLSYKHWRIFLTQLIPNIGVVTVATLQYTIVSFLAASLGTTEIAAHNCLICLFEIVHTSSIGMAEATSIRIGSHLGRGDSRGALRTAQIALIAASSLGVLIASLGWFLHSYVARIFTDDPAVLAEASTLRSLMWAGFALLAVGDAGGGVLEGQGQNGGQAVAAIVGIFVCIPLAVVSAHLTSFGLRGLWGAMLIGYFFVDLIVIAFIFFSNWEKLAIDAAQTAARGEEGEEGDVF